MLAMIGDQIRALRRKNKISQTALSKALGVTQSAVGMWETNKREPDLATLQKIASFFDAPLSELIGESSQTGKDIYEQIKKAASGDDARSRVIDLVSQLSPEQSYLALAYLQGLLAQPPQPGSPQAAPKEQ